MCRACPIESRPMTHASVCTFLCGDVPACCMHVPTHQTWPCSTFWSHSCGVNQTHGAYRPSREGARRLWKTRVLLGLNLGHGQVRVWRGYVAALNPDLVRRMEVGVANFGLSLRVKPILRGSRYLG
jgi:hypothetical protein